MYSTEISEWVPWQWGPLLWFPCTWSVLRSHRVPSAVLHFPWVQRVERPVSWVPCVCPGLWALTWKDGCEFLSPALTINASKTVAYMGVGGSPRKSTADPHGPDHVSILEGPEDLLQSHIVAPLQFLDNLIKVVLLKENSSTACIFPVFPYSKLFCTKS